MGFASMELPTKLEDWWEAQGVMHVKKNIITQQVSKIT